MSVPIAPESEDGLETSSAFMLFAQGFMYQWDPNLLLFAFVFFFFNTGFLWVALKPVLELAV